MKNKTLIIIPVKNEGKNILQSLPVKSGHDILVIYDDCYDSTLPYLRDLEAVTTRRNNYSGFGGAIKTVLAPLYLAKYQYVVVLMGDGSDRVLDIDKMILKAEQGYDIVCASRYTLNASHNGNNLTKKYLSMFAGKTLKFLTGIATSDITNNFKLYRTNIFNEIKPTSNGFDIGMEITVKAFVNKCKITEIPTVWTDRKSGKSNFKILRQLPKYLKWWFYALLED